MVHIFFGSEYFDAPNILIFILLPKATRLCQQKKEAENPTVRCCMWQEVQPKIPSAWHSGCCRTMDLLSAFGSVATHLYGAYIYMNVSRGNMRPLKACNMWADHGYLVGRVLVYIDGPYAEKISLFWKIQVEDLIHDSRK